MFGVAVWLRLAAHVPVELEGSEVAGEAHAPIRPENEPRVVEEGTMEPAAGTAERSSSASAREQRYRELLREPPPAAPPAPAKEPSLFDRVVAPIAQALGVEKSKPQPPAPGNPARGPRPQQSSSQQPEREARGESPRPEETTTRDAQQEQDPDTDIIPPTLTMASFVPQQVQDGESTTLTAVVTDNLSGVRGVSGVIVSPSGALQGFSCRREGDRYVASIAVPKEAAAGEWSIRYMTLSDNASNSVNLNAAQARASFTVVSSRSDSTAPLLRDVRIDRAAMTAGEANTIRVVAEDDKSGVAQVSGVFVSPSKTARLGFGCRDAGGTWECNMTPPKCLDCGLWQLEQVQVQDKANNLATFRMDNPIVSRINLDITGESCDSEPPLLQSLVLNPLVVSNLEGGAIRVEALLADEGCGVASLSGQAVPPDGVGGQRAYFSLEPAGDGRMFVGTIRIDKFAAKGQWTIAWMQALDKGHNLRQYATNHPVIARVTFRVE